MAKVNLTDIERDTILAALRLWQATKDRIPEELRDIATDGGSHPLMDESDIDTLCENKINV